VPILFASNGLIVVTCLSCFWKWMKLLIYSSIWNDLIFMELFISKHLSSLGMLGVLLCCFQLTSAANFKFLILFYSRVTYYCLLG